MACLADCEGGRAALVQCDAPRLMRLGYADEDHGETAEAMEIAAEKFLRFGMVPAELLVRQLNKTLVFESEVSVTKEMVDRARPPPKEEKEPTAQKQQPRATPEQLGFERPPPVERREREDLYSDKWAGDEYVGDGFWNELTVGIAIFVAVPGIITLVATPLASTAA